MSVKVFTEQVQCSGRTLRVLVVNPPHPAIGSRIPDDHLPPLGLLCIAGPLIDDGHQVALLDCEFGPMPVPEILQRITDYAPDLLLIGHSGSTSAHPMASEIALLAKRRRSELTVVYGGVYPSYHWRDILAEQPEFDYLVRGEGEETCRQLIRALATDAALDQVDGIAYRQGTNVVSTAQRATIDNLDDYRIAWELIDFKKYSYWGRRRAVVMQFSRGCPHPCSYCGQRGFWTRWRHRNPERFAREIADLHRTHGIEVFNLADENPTSSRKMWKRFLVALIDENVSVRIVGSTRADDIVRDRDYLHLYKQAGVERFLLGMENTDDAVLKKIRKGSTSTTDREAIRLLRQHGILSMATWVVGFEEERDRDYWRVLRQLLSYDPDQIQSVYVTPHRWTPFFDEAKDREVIQGDQSKWDYKHQVLKTRHMAPWRVFTWVKFIELAVQTRPRALWRLLTLPEARLRQAQRWYYQMGRRVWFFELANFLFHDKRWRNGVSLTEYWGESLSHEEQALRRTGRKQQITIPVNVVPLDTLTDGESIKERIGYAAP